MYQTAIVAILLMSFASPVRAATAWRVGGFLAQNPTKKTWVSILDGRIACIDFAVKNNEIPNPKNCIENTDLELVKKSVSIETEDYIFPGMMDLHNHIEFNSLPLWQEAKGQFQNRFEWRDIEGYQKGPHKYFMRLMKLDSSDPDYETLKDFACLSLQWSELKALTGGVTAIQGMGRRENEVCAKSFGIRNLEIASSMGLKDKSISGAMEVLNPESIETGFNVFIRPHLRDDMSNYSEAFKVFDEHFKLSQWLHDFKNNEHTIENAIRLTIGSAAEKHLKKLKTPLTKEEAPDFIRSILSAESKKLNIAPEDIDKIAKKILGWTFEAKIQNVAFVEIDIENPDIDKLALSFLNPNKFNRTEREFDAVLHIPREARDYLVSFELGILQGLRNRLAKPNLLAYLTHLAEGRRGDDYNSQEYLLAKSLGLMKPNFIPIHGVGFSKTAFSEMAKNNQGLVISPTSNLLLYGESIDIKAAAKSGVLLALGSDWSITGTKTLLDEIRVLSKYAKKEGAVLSQKKLVEMLSQNPAKILRLESEFGQVALGYQADILVIKNKNKNPYKALLDSNQEDIQLVTVKGEPLYGDASVLSTLAAGIGDMNHPEIINKSFVGNDKDCELLLKANKAFRLPSWLNTEQRFSVKKIKEELIKVYKVASERFNKEFSKEGLALDPLFSCEDSYYRKTINQLSH